MSPSIPQILIILAIVLLLFGTKRLRNVGSDLGEAIRGFKKGLGEGSEGGDKPTATLGQDSPQNTHSAPREAERDRH